jgi:hypothetical protein
MEIVELKDFYEILFRLQAVLFVLIVNWAFGFFLYRCVKNFKRKKGWKE